MFRKLLQCSFRKCFSIRDREHRYWRRTFSSLINDERRVAASRCAKYRMFKLMPSQAERGRNEMIVEKHRCMPMPLVKMRWLKGEKRGKKAGRQHDHSLFRLRVNSDAHTQPSQQESLKVTVEKKNGFFEPNS